MNIFCVIVSYNPNYKNIFDLIKRLIDQDVFVIWVDNFSDNFKGFSELKGLNQSKIDLITLSENYGIAHAQNVGIEKAIQLGADSIVFFDQDSEIDEKFIHNLTTDYNTLREKGINVAAIGPRFVDKKLGFYAPGLIVKKTGLISKKDLKNISQPEAVGMIISSGSLIPVHALKDIGLMNQDLFIDYVDTEWCLRALKKGYQIYISDKATMYHSVGESTITLFGRTCPVHSAHRRYYRVRNLFLMMRMSHIRKLWIVSMIINNIIAQIILFITQKKKFSYMYYFILSIIDGLKGKKGSL